MRVKVYRNLHKNCYSIVAMEGQSYGRVAGHLPEVCLKDAEFRVSQAGRQRVLREKRKNVHAYVVGHMTDEIPTNPEKVRYNPYEAGDFMSEAGPVKKAALCHLTTTGIEVEFEK